MKNLINYSFFSKDGLTISQDKTVLFCAEGEPLLQREYVADGNEKVTTEEYLVLNYRAKDILRVRKLRQGVICGVLDQKEEDLFSINEMTTDGNLHRIIIKSSNKEFDFLRLRLFSRSPKMYFEIVDFYTCSYDELPKRFETTDFKEGYKCIDISGNCNDSISTEAGIIDGGIGNLSGKVGLLNVPFLFSENGGMIRPQAGPNEINNEIIDNFTAVTKRKLCRPESRESRFTIEIDDFAKEVYFVLYVDGLMHERFTFCAPDPAILGISNGEVMMPLKVNDIERFAVFVNYEDGTIDECFPTNLKTLRHEIIGEVGIYGVKAYDKKIKSISFEDRLLDTDISLVALTLNQTAENILPEMFPQRQKTAVKQFDYDAELSLNEDILTIKNGGFLLQFETLNGLFVKKAVSAFCDTFKMQGFMLKVRDNGKLISNFERISIEITNQAKIIYKYESLLITVFIKPTEKDGVMLDMKVENSGEQEKSIGVLFPVLSNIEYRSSQDTWYFLPKYQNTESNGNCYVYEESAPSYPMQFMDVFSPKEGAGLALTTRERDLKVRKYALIKQEQFTEAFVEYPDMYCRITPNGVFKGTQTTIFTHEGDWHASYEAYKCWLDSWYEPYNCQDKLWYRQKFWLLAEIPDFIENKSVCNFPIWYNKETKEYRFQSIMDKISEIYGETPDILHLWGWTWYDQGNHMLWGNFGKEDYEKIGGLENFRKALNDVSEKTGAEISLYVHPTLLSSEYPQSKDFYPHYRVKAPNGAFIGNLGAYRMCHAERGWRDYVIEMYKNIYKDMGTRLFYVDEFSLRVDNRCYNEEHAHDCPSNLLKTDRDFITSLKDETPKDIVLYGEYYTVDVNARYIDCNISYYILDSINRLIEQGVHSDDGSDEYGRVFTDIYRFAFPKIVQLILPMAMRKLTWQPLKATFFNGEAIYDSFWDTEETRGRHFMAKSYRIKKDYADCFSSNNPETMINGENDAVCVNKFPGDNRTVYTLYNRSYHTYMGNVVKLPYKESARYYDIWNGKDAEFEIIDGYAYIKSTVTAQGVGAIAEIF